MTDMRVALPEGTLGDVEIRKLTVPEQSLANLRLTMQGRGCRPGDYTALYRNGVLWMSDTTAEQRDHFEAAYQIRQHGGRVLIAGLGLGMIVKHALDQPNVDHVDVVEIDPDVAKLVGQHYEGPRCTIHVADMFTIKWPSGTRWDTAWFDIWPDLCTDNLDEMGKLARSYGRRVSWQGYWGKELLQRTRRQEQQRSGWW